LFFPFKVKFIYFDVTSMPKASMCFSATAASAGIRDCVPNAVVIKMAEAD